MIRIENGLVLSGRGLQKADVLIEGNVIVAVGETARSGATAETVDAEGCWVGPGFVDLHVHLREPGQTYKEDIETGSRAAAAGGYTAIVAMPNTEPAMDDVATIEEVVGRARQVGLVDVVPAGAVTVGRSGERATDLEGLYQAGVRIFTDDGDSVGNPELARSVMERLAKLDGALLSQHAEDASVTSGGHMHDCELSHRLGIGGLPTVAETAVVARDLELVRETGVRYHCQHVSAAETVALIRSAKTDGLAVTAEVTPHHLSFDVSALETLDTNLKMYPPIRTETDRLALVAALADGTIDVVATDHAPHTQEEKAVPFEDAPRGVIGLETAASVVLDTLGDPVRLFEAMSVQPAQIASLGRHGRPVAAGEPANLVVVDPAVEWVCESFHSRSSNSPYRGHVMRGRARATIHEGELVHQLEGVG